MNAATSSTHEVDRLGALHVEIDTLWESDGRGRLTVVRNPSRAPAPCVVIAACPEGYAAACGAAVQDVLAARIAEVIAHATPQPDAGGAPDVLRACRNRLENELGATTLSSGPSYLVPPGTSFPPAATILRSTDATPPATPPEAGWDEAEWQALVSEELGPWAMAMLDGSVVAICHSARLTDRGAEAGVWTHPAHRGRGQAAAVTAAWAALVSSPERLVFYSTSEENRSSQRVAARLKLPLLGRMWLLSTAPPS